MTKFIFIVGGVMSGVGKGTVTASLGTVLQGLGYRVTAMKIDPYVNVDAGTMNPTEHGEVFVTDDGDETDQDIGSYERFLGASIGKVNYMTTGRVYQSVIHRERNLEYGGRCVEVVPHIPEEVLRRIRAAAKEARAEIVLIEVGGTVGEYQNVLFLEAARLLKLSCPRDVATVLVSYLPIPGHIGEMKTKPTQHATHLLQAAGIQPDLIIARGERALDEPRRRKLSMFCNVGPDDVIAAPDVASTYEVPVNFNRERIGERVLGKLGLLPRRRDLRRWTTFVRTARRVSDEVRIAIAGKYFTTGDFVLADVYLSVIEAVKHAAWVHHRKPVLTWLNTEAYERDPKMLDELLEFDGVIIPGGFGSRGVEGKIRAIQRLRERKIPYLGLCYGMQLACIEFARHVLKLRGAHTTEIDPKTPHRIISLMEEQVSRMKRAEYGGTMRLGAYACRVTAGTHAAAAYRRTSWEERRYRSGDLLIHERHRHRYEFDNQYRSKFERAGFIFSGVNPERDLVEIIELPRDVHPFFVGVQFHPEFKSRPLDPHPLFRAFIGAAVKERASPS
ncbi:CTP synthase [Candidatus Uhrbacteria bacterium]|nr:CTP synthase [Candidatus Uhrbacteria bacterium]